MENGGGLFGNTNPRGKIQKIEKDIKDVFTKILNERNVL